MKEFLYHALGVCGEQLHPHLINVTAIVAVTIVVTSIVVYRRARQ